MKRITLAFNAYLEQLNKRFDRSEHLLKQIFDDNLIKESLISVAITLYVAMEHIERSENRKILERYADKLNNYKDIIINNWNKSERNLWGDFPELIHTSNLGIYYGALNAFKRIADNKDVQRELILIRDFIFDNNLYKGTLVSSAKNNEVSSDLLVTVVPFGLFSPEDLVMVEAIKEIESYLIINGLAYKYQGGQGISPTSSAWLSWYFAEKGDLKKARYYLSISKSLNENYDTGEKELANIFINIATHYINEILQSNSEIKIIHTPYGNYNPYETLKTERFPKDPEVNQNVKVRTLIWPCEENLEVYVRVETNKRIYEVQCYEVIDENEVIWEASIGKFDFDEVVNYYFIVKENETIIKKGDSYSFFPMIINYLNSVQDYGLTRNTFWVKGCDQFNINSIYISISNKDNGFQLKIDYDEASFNRLLYETELNNFNQSVSNVEYFDEEEKIVVKSSYWICHIIKSPFNLKIYNLSGDILLQGYKQILPNIQWWVKNNGEIKKVKLNFLSPLNERFFGFGERYNRIEQRGEKLDCYVYNQYRDQGTKTYIPVPFYLSSLGYGLFIESPNYSQFDMASYFEDLLSIESDISYPNSISFRIFMGSPKEILSGFTNLTGKPILPPKWAFGPWMSSNNWDRESVVRKQVELTNHYKIPSTVLVIEQWSDEATYYIFNDANYTVKNGKEFFDYEEFEFPDWGRWNNPKKLIEDLHNEGLKVILWQIPIQKYLNKQFHSQKDADEKQMIEAGFCVKDSNGQPYRIPEGWFKESLLMDFSNPEGKKWWFNKRKYLLDIGVDGFKTDGGEFVFGNTLQFADGRTGAEMRNQYPNDYVQAYYDFANNYHQGNGLTFSRAGFTGAQNFPAHWAGDERSTFSAFKNSLIAGLTSGISGIPFWGWDLAGFNGDIPSAELFIRSTEMAAFCPIMQYHAESKGEFNQDRTPWNIAERTGDFDAITGYRYYANVRMNLIPYIYDQSRGASETGLPLMRALFIDYPNDDRTYSIYDQYLFGNNLLVAPIIEEGATERMVYFPDGLWIDLWSNRTIQGPAWLRVESSLMEIPVYVKEDSAILCNCDNSLSLGSWVGNSVEQYTLPVLRIYPVKGFKQEIHDHLNEVWNVKIDFDGRLWNIKLDTNQEVIILLPVDLIDQQEIKINGLLKLTNNLEIKDSNYIIKIN